MSSKVKKAIAVVGPDLVGLAGFGLVLYGIGQFSQPAAAILGGLLLIFVSVRLG